MYNKMSFGENLINLRRQKGWSQDDLANNLNISRQAISKWETDISKPDVDNLERISKIFSVTIDNLLDNDLPNDKAVALDVKKKEKKEKTITIVKLMIIAVIILYAISVIYKFASLLVIVNGVQKYANLNNYHYVITTYDENGLVEKEECWFKDGVSKTVTDTISGENVTCIDYENNNGYMTLNDSKNRIDINMDDYNMAHDSYKSGGQLMDIFPEIFKKDSLILTFLDTMHMKFDIYEDQIIIKTYNNYIMLEKNGLLPVMMFSNDNKSTKVYIIDIGKLDKVEI